MKHTQHSTRATEKHCPEHFLKDAVGDSVGPHSLQRPASSPWVMSTLKDEHAEVRQAAMDISLARDTHGNSRALPAPGAFLGCPPHQSGTQPGTDLCPQHPGLRLQRNSSPQKARWNHPGTCLSPTLYQSLPLWLGVALHTCDSSTWETEGEGGSEFETSQGYK